MNIYNRWGQEVYNKSDEKVYWDARNVTAGAYYYILNADQNNTDQHYRDL
jgi:hypothetical protein